VRDNVTTQMFSNRSLAPRDDGSGCPERDVHSIRREYFYPSLDSSSSQGRLSGAILELPAAARRRM
jgi:hypothetical protein